MLRKSIFILVALISFNSNSQNLHWVKQIYPLNFDIVIRCSDTYINASNVICGEFRDSMYFGFAPGLLGENNNTGEPKPYILKTDYDGNHLWHKILDAGMITETRIDNNGNILFALRHSSSSLDIDPGPGVVNVSNGIGGYEHILIKLSSSGDYLWHKIMPIGGTSAMEFELTSTDDIVVTGDFGSPFTYAGQPIACWGIENSFILEVDESGSENWVKRIGGTTSSSFSSSYSRELDIDGSGNIFIAGEIEGTIDFDPSASSSSMNSGNNSKFFLAKYSSTGDYVFATEQGTTDNGNFRAMTVNSSGEAHITLDHDPTIGTESGFTVRKCDVAGATNWEHIYLGADLNTFAQAIESDESGNTYYSGAFTEDSMDLDPGVGVDFMVNPNPWLIGNMGFVVKLDPNGDYLWSYHLDHLALYSATQAYTSFNNLKMIEPNSLFVTNEQQASTLFKLNVNGNLDVSDIDSEKGLIKIYPNPSNGQFIIEHPFNEVNARIFDVNGRMVQELTLGQDKSAVSTDLNPGTYLIHVNNEIRRIIIQK